MTSSRYETVDVPGVGTYEAYCAAPNHPAPGVLVFQEIFGINDNMRELADRFAEAGYVALVPDMFWRIEPRFERNDEAGMADAFERVQKFDREGAIVDIHAAHVHLAHLPECNDKIGATGFCLGGALAFAAAATSKVDGKGIDAAVCYYGSAINDMLTLVDHIECPVMYHYGNADAYIPPENIDEVERAVANCPDVEFHRYDAGHAFSNADAPSMYHEPSAKLAWGRTIEFFDRHLR
jgi:carboxymethylenebutenolidase